MASQLVFDSTADRNFDVVADLLQTGGSQFQLTKKFENYTQFLFPKVYSLNPNKSSVCKSGQVIDQLSARLKKSTLSA